MGNLLWCPVDVNVNRDRIKRSIITRRICGVSGSVSDWRWAIIGEQNMKENQTEHPSGSSDGRADVCLFRETLNHIDEASSATLVVTQTGKAMSKRWGANRSPEVAKSRHGSKSLWIRSAPLSSPSPSPPCPLHSLRIVSSCNIGLIVTTKAWWRQLPTGL